MPATQPPDESNGSSKRGDEPQSANEVRDAVHNPASSPDARHRRWFAPIWVLVAIVVVIVIMLIAYY